MKQQNSPTTFTNSEDYLSFEVKSGFKHEFLNKKVITMTGVSFEHNEITLTIALLMKQLLKGTKWKIAIEAVKTKDADGNFFYPDLMVCHPNPDKYFSTQPVLLVEVLSSESRRFDLVDKFIQYQKIETLQYYLCVEPEQQVVLFYNKNAEGEWTIETFTKEEDTINLPQLNSTFTLRHIYKPE